MISQKLVQLIERHADELTARWLKDVRQNPDTFSFHRYPEEKLREEAYDLYSHLGRWIQSEVNRGQAEEVFTKLGTQRYHGGFKLSEVVKSLVLVKRHLWLFVQEQGFFESAVELYQVLELFNSVILFFDRATFFVVRGFEKEANLYRNP